MSRAWSILFCLVPILCLVAFAMAANGVGPLNGAWLPDNFSKSGESIDHLWYVVHWICGFILLLTGLLLGWAVFRFAGNRDNVSATYTTNNRALEITWTIIPGAILVALAFYQLNAWSVRRVERPMQKVGDQMVAKPPMVRVVAKQFGWEFHYTGADQKFGTLDDFQVENLMVVPDDETIVLTLESKDVIHSFFVPKLRLKHDVVPGMIQTAWFTPTQSAEVNIVCAELCGWGHYKMNARLRMVSRKQFANWVGSQQERIAPPTLQPYTESKP